MVRFANTLLALILAGSMAGAMTHRMGNPYSATTITGNMGRA